MGTRAAIFIQRGVEVRKQAAACMDYIDQERWSMLHVVPYYAPDDAMRLVHDGTVDVIVTAYDSRAVRALAEDIGPDGKVMFIHPAPTVVEVERRHGTLPTLGDLLRRWLRRGMSVKEMADEIDGDTADIREILRKMGEEPGRSD
jgi:hypothetical protein